MIPHTPHEDDITPLAVPVAFLVESDLELAQRLQAEEDARATATFSSSSTQHLPILQDEAYARRLDQELRDQQYAQSLQEQEQSRNIPVVMPLNIIPDAEVQRAQAVALQQQEEERFRRRRRHRNRNCVITILVFILVGGFVAGILYFGNFFGRNSLPPFIKDPWNNKPGNGTSLGQYELWPNTGQGLKLTIQDALTDNWYPYFRRAVLDWDEAPALTLTITNASKADPTCTPIRGILKICNKDYGDSGWLGINDSILQNNYIYSSVAKMNEYYLNKSSNSLRQYVMCHEIGHGFGLPHRDENFNNPDLGTCLDYTSRPQNNMHPNSVDFDHLAQLYLNNQNPSRMLLPVISTLPLLHLPELDKRWSYTEGRLLHKSKHGEIWETLLADNVLIRTTVLLASSQFERA